MVTTQERPAIFDEHLEALQRDVKTAARTLNEQEARFLVDAYYQVQEYRMIAQNQVRAMLDEPHETFTFFSRQLLVLEKQLQGLLDTWSKSHPLGAWARANKGIGPVLAAGLLAHIDMHKAPTVGHIWNFAGLNPTITWSKGQKRPWNAKLKVIQWKIGEAFTKVSGREGAYYGHLYKLRKQVEQIRNERGLFADQAEQILATRRINKDTEAYKAYSVGKLPPAHIHARAKRFAVKRFLSDYHHVGYELTFGELPPRPYVIEHLGHAHLTLPPHHECIGHGQWHGAALSPAEGLRQLARLWDTEWEAGDDAADSDDLDDLDG